MRCVDIFHNVARPTDRAGSTPGEKYRGLLFSQFIAQISHANRDSLEQSLNYRRYRRRRGERCTARRARASRELKSPF